MDGIPTLLAGREGPLFGGLVFRVGRGDETLATAGVTHLVEHLALYRLNMSDLHHNGQTANTYTIFHATGTREEVVEFLNGVCASLRDLPLDRLETEKEILRTEATRREGPKAFEAMALWRYGAQGPGLQAYDEAGLSRLTGDDVTAWVRSHFTRDNAAMFLTSATLPDGLDLALPAGQRRPVVLPPEMLPDKPAWFRGARGGIVVDSIVPRSTEASMFASLADRTLFRTLRQERGLSYTAACDYEPVSEDRARITAHADALPEKEDAVVRAVVEVLHALRDGTVDDGDLATVRKRAQQALDVPDLGASLLPSTALNVLIGHPVRHPDELRAEQEAVTGNDIAGVARAFWDDALAQVPGEGLEWAGFAAAPAFSDSAVAGVTYPHADEPWVALVIGDDGVTLRTPQGCSTVRFQDCVLMEAVPDGARRLIGRDGFRVVVEPTLYPRLTREVVWRSIDARVQPDVVLRLPARSGGSIPLPRVSAVSAPHTFRVLPRWRGLGAWARTLGIFVLCVAFVATLIGAADAGDLAAGTPTGASVAGAVVECLVALAAWIGGGLLVFGAARRRAL